MLGFDRVVVNLEERRATISNIPASLEELVEEIDLADYIQAMLISPALEGRVAILIVPLLKPTLTPEPSEASQITTVDKSKGTYVSQKKKKATPTKPIVIGALILSVVLT